MLHRWKLRTYFIALAVASMAVALAGVVYVSAQSAHDGRTRAAADASHAAGLASKQVGDGVALLGATVAQLAAAPSITEALVRPEECSLSFGGPAGVESGHIDVLDAKGQVICSSQPPAKGQRLPNYLGAAWLAKAKRGPVLDAPIEDPASNAHAIVSAAPFKGGVVAGFLTLEPAGPELAKLFGGGRPTELLVVSRGDRRIIARSVAAERWVGQQLPARAVPSSRGLTAINDLEGVPRIYRSAPIAGTNWQLWVGRDEAAALADAHTLRDRQLVIIGIGLALLLLATALVYRSVARPIAQLGRRVRQATPTDLEPVPVEGPDEIADLAESVNGFIGSIRQQLTRREAAEADARAAADNYRQLFERSPLPMWIHDLASGQMLAVNHAALRVYGYSRDAFMELSLADVQVNPTEHRRYDDSSLEVRTAEHNVRFAGHDGRLVIAEDVGERERLERQIQQGQRMEAIGRLAGGIAHDFNNLLVAIVGYSDLLLAQLDEGDETHAEVREIKSAGQRGVGLTKQLLSFARGHEVKAQVLDINEVIAGIQPLLRQLLPTTVAIETDLSAAAGAIEVDRSQLEQVLVNLAVNAAHAMPDGGRLRLATATTQAPDDERAQRTIIEVGDTGVGMDEVTLAHMFEPFFTTRDEGEGTGLGLATVYRIVEQSRGEVTATSELGVGTTFTITLPTAVDASETVRPGDAGSPAEARHRRVLLVDDDDAVRAVVKRMLEHHGFALLEASTGEQALELSDGQPADDLDLIVTDSVVPGPGGLSLARQVQHRHPHIQMLIMSGYGKHEALGGESASDASFIAKPFTRDQLEASLNSLDQQDGR